ncbi:MAG: M56 family metallopeptidase, partial [Planctomycetes bacterium]|nr:M56 family metallopeptidase [Planctomycetota bacterium]
MPTEVLELAWRHTWQVTLLAAVMSAAVGLWGRNRPHLAHALWLAVLLKCITPPIWASALGVFCWIQPEERLELDLAAAPMVHVHELPLSLAAAGDGDSVTVDDDELFLGHDRPEFPGPTVAKDSEWLKSAASWQSAWQISAWAFATLWCLGSGLWLVKTLVRSQRCWREIQEAACPTSPELLAALEQLQRRLRIQRRVRLVISATRIGPAVMGLFRPVIVLPEVIVVGRPVADLVPILAHELIHVRRGDLWVGCLQTLACGVWWFHPLVRGICRALVREAERCVDEELISALCCEPAQYARTLLNVLELKQSLKPVPVFPGMKPVEITTQRLERIMSLRQGCRERTPWWCWSALLLVLALALPGRALLAVDESNPTADGPRGPRVERIERYYDVADLLERLAQRHELSPANAQQLLVDFLVGTGTVVSPEDKSTLRILASAARHQEIAARLKAWGEVPFDQLLIKATVLQVPEPLVREWFAHDAEPSPESRQPVTADRLEPASSEDLKA